MARCKQQHCKTLQLCRTLRCSTFPALCTYQRHFHHALLGCLSEMVFIVGRSRWHWAYHCFIDRVPAPFTATRISTVRHHILCNNQLTRQRAVRPCRVDTPVAAVACCGEGRRALCFWRFFWAEVYCIVAVGLVVLDVAQGEVGVEGSVSDDVFVHITIDLNVVIYSVFRTLVSILVVLYVLKNSIGKTVHTKYLMTRTIAD